MANPWYPYPGDLGDQPAYVAAGVEACESEYARMQGEHDRRELRRIERESKRNG